MSRPRRTVRIRRAVNFLVLVASSLKPVDAREDEVMRNWFDDPFFQISHAIEECLEPVGPRMTEQARRTQAHHRAERGTACWLQGECDLPNAHAYDKAIADRIAEQWNQDPRRRETTIWVTVQARVVYFEGCVPAEQAAVDLEMFGRQIPSVQQAIAAVTWPGRSEVPYRIWSALSESGR